MPRTKKKLITTAFLFIALLLVYLMPDSSGGDELNLGNDNIEYNYSNIYDVIYLLDSNDYVARVEVNTSEKKDAGALVSMLINEGKYEDKIPNGFHSLIPAGTEVLDVSLDNKIITINFSKEFLNINEKYEEKMISALVYTLTSLEGIDGVILKVEGDVLGELPNSKKVLPSIIDKSYGINKQYALTKTADIDSYTLYYVSSFKDNIYYVPVTKYVNNSGRDKIKVIIDELSSVPVYDNTLMSFLNNNTSLLDYDSNDDTINLNFSEEILNSSNNDILEEVIYTIYLTLEDNLNIHDLNIEVNNKPVISKFNN